jgi:hypothetical protein
VFQSVIPGLHVDGRENEKEGLSMTSSALSAWMRSIAGESICHPWIPTHM